MSYFEKWKALHKLNKELMSEIKLFCVFGETEDEVLVVTKVDEVFAFGSNRNGCLGLGTDDSIQELKKVVELCNKNVLKFAYGLSHVIAITEQDNGLYSWGNNNFGQLADGTTANRNKPQLIVGLIGQKVIDISCGAYFTVVLTESGNVFSFGYNCFGQLGCNSTYDQSVPVQVVGFESEKVTSLACGFEHSTALTEAGHVFVWGANNLGQLGLGNREDQYIPTRVKHLDSVIIRKIVCGSAHNLLLSSDQDIYAFGWNYKGQIGSGSYYNHDLPIRVNGTLKFSDIAATFYNDLSVALSLSGNCFIWGQTESLTEYIPSPKETDEKSIDNIFAVYAFRNITHKMIQIQ